LLASSNPCASAADIASAVKISVLDRKMAM
jgi:hypothetical protein